MSAVKWLIVEIGQKIDTYEIPDIVIAEALEIEQVRLKEAYQDGKDFAIINHLATESTSAAHNKEVHRQQIIAAYIAAKMERNKVKKHFAYFLKLERVQIAAQEYYNDTYGDGVQ
jgi:acid stress-induced BolA-like protein IbaG/YrbA